MKNVLLSLVLVCIVQISFGQIITITAGDMPVAGDTLRYSTALGATSGINVNDSGTNKTWVYDTMKPILQTLDTYKFAATVNIAFVLTDLTAYGYKIADSIPGLGTLGAGLSIKNIYNFFNKKTSPDRYLAEGIGATVTTALGSAPTAASYSDPDEIYYFPLTYPHTQDSSSFAININLATVGSLKRQGYRKTTVDGWGTIKTPYYKTATNCIRIRSEIHEIDTINIPLLSLNLPLVMDTIEYKWLVNGGHYPALWVTQSKHTSVLTSVTYRDSLRHGVLSVNNQPQLSWQAIQAYPNPVTKGDMHLVIPADWSDFTVLVYDNTGRVVADFKNKNQFNVNSLSSGKYILLIKCNNNIGISQIAKQ